MPPTIFAFANALSTVGGSYTVAAIVVAFGIAGVRFRFSAEWQLLFTLYLSILAILQTGGVLVEQRQSAETARRRDEAMHLKLDSLLHGVDKADDALAGIEKQVEETLTQEG